MNVNGKEDSVWTRRVGTEEGSTALDLAKEALQIQKQDIEELTDGVKLLLSALSTVKDSRQIKLQMLTSTPKPTRRPQTNGV